MPAPALAVEPLIENHIFIIRGQKIILDEDLATLYDVETKRLNEAVRRNSNRFPQDFMFRLNRRENKAVQGHLSNANLSRGGRRNLPYAFTELGVSMLSSVLNSERAIESTSPSCALSFACVKSFPRTTNSRANFTICV